MAHTYLCSAENPGTPRGHTHGHQGHSIIFPRLSLSSEKPSSLSFDSLSLDHPKIPNPCRSKPSSSRQRHPTSSRRRHTSPTASSPPPHLQIRDFQIPAKFKLFRPFSGDSGTMSLECLTWIPHLWDKLICSLNVRKDSFAMQDFPKEILICSLNVRKDGFYMQDLPEDILIDILSRLPGNCVLERRRVCKQWLALTSTPNFLEMHLKRATPVLFVQFVDHVGKMDMFIFDEGAKANQMIKKMGAEFMHLEASLVPDLCGSCNGLLLFRSIIPSSLSLVWNPLTGEKVTIRTPVGPVIVCGIFFHPLTNDYKVLFVYHKQRFSLTENVDIKYFLYSLRGQCWRKLDDFPYLPSVVAPPAILNGAVHWMVNCYSLNDIPPNGGSGSSIMMFNMDAEEFGCMPHPRLECPVWKVGKYIRLFEMKGKLAFCHVHSSHVYLWILEDYENWIWGGRYSVNLHLYVKRYPLDITHIGPRYTDSLITLVDIQNDELLFDYRSRGLFRYNLRQKTIKQINGVGMKQMPLLPFSDSKRCIISYTKTFVSPGGFK